MLFSFPALRFVNISLTPAAEAAAPPAAAAAARIASWGRCRNRVFFYRRFWRLKSQEGLPNFDTKPDPSPNPNPSPDLVGAVDVADERFDPILVFSCSPFRSKVGQDRRDVEHVGVVEVLRVAEERFCSFF